MSKPIENDWLCAKARADERERIAAWIESHPDWLLEGYINDALEGIRNGEHETGKAK